MSVKKFYKMLPELLFFGFITLIKNGMIFMKINGDKKSFSKTSSNMQHAALVNTLDAIWGTSKGVRQLCSKKRKEVLCKKRRLNRSCLDSEIFLFIFYLLKQTKKLRFLWKILTHCGVCCYYYTYVCIWRGLFPQQEINRQCCYNRRIIRTAIKWIAFTKFRQKTF